MYKTQYDLFTMLTPSMPKLDTSRCVIRPISYSVAKNMIKNHHYTHRVPSITVAIGMYVDDILAGCITYGMPPNRDMFSSFGEKYAGRGVELNRLFIHDWAGHNSESWLIGQSFKFLTQHYPEYCILVSYADSTVNHTGYIYQATNWFYTGTTQAREHFVLDGKIYHRRDIGRVFSSLSDVIEKGGEVIYDKPKHRYLYFLGSKKQRKELCRLLSWPILPYPKEG